VISRYVFVCMYVYIYIYIYIYRFIVNSAALYVEQSVWGMKAGVGQSNSGEKQTESAGYVTNMGTWRDILG
jgi:hypothetical protein